MITNTKPRRQTAGFIRTTSHKALPTFNREERFSKDQSSDEFSSFQNCEKNREDSQTQFSPYKFNKNMQKPPLPHTIRAETRDLVQQPTRKHREKCGSLRNLSNSQNKKDHHEVQIKRILEKRTEVQNQLNEIGKIYEKINELEQSKKQTMFFKDPSLKVHPSTKPKSELKIQYSFDEQDSEDIQITNQNRNTINDDHQFTVSPKNSKSLVLMSKFKKQHKLLQRQEFQFEESSVEYGKGVEEESSSFKCFQNDVLFRQGSLIQQPQDFIKIRHERARNNFIQENQQDSLEASEESENGQELIQQYKGDEFKKIVNREGRDIAKYYKFQETSPTKMSNHLQPKSNFNSKPVFQEAERRLQHKMRIDSPGFHKTKGGICFDLDVNEFMHQEVQNKPNFVKTVVCRPKKKNSKEQILKRRQMAKNYDKQARMRVFGNY